MNNVARLSAILLTATLLVACRNPTAPTPTGTSRFIVTSDPDHLVGMGTPYTYTRENARFEATVDQGGASLGIDVIPNEGQPGQWIILLEAPPGRTVVPGSYTFARDSGRGVYGLELFVSPGGRRCDTTGQIVIQEAAYTSTSVLRFRATFEHRCRGSSPALRGELVVLNDPPR